MKVGVGNGKFLSRQAAAAAWWLLCGSGCHCWEATWESLDSRPIPEWYLDAKLGIFIHWGIYSVPSFGSEWFWKRSTDELEQATSSSDEAEHSYRWFLNATQNLHRYSYPQYAHKLDATLFNATYWAQVFSQSGARYVVMTAKHHDGYCMWNATTSVPTAWNWNVMDIGPKRDLLGELANAVKQTTVQYYGDSQLRLKWGVYHSLLEWYNPLFLRDIVQNAGATQDFVNLKVLPELYDLVERYQPELIWSDGVNPANSSYWKATEFLAWFATRSPVAATAVWNDRWGLDTRCRHGAYFTCHDRYQPDALPSYPWESAMTLDKTSWGYNRNATLEDYLTTKEVIYTLVATVALGGNLLLNVGPRADGTLPPIFVDRLMGLGDWLRVNSHGIFHTRPWKVCQNETSEDIPIYYTFAQKHITTFAIFTKWPHSNSLLVRTAPLSFFTSNSRLQVHFVTGQEQEKWIPVVWEQVATPPFETTMTTEADNDKNTCDSAPQFRITLPRFTPNNIPCQHAWTLVMQYHQDDLDRDATTETRNWL